MARSHHNKAKERMQRIHATQLYYNFKHPLGRKVSWRSAIRMALNWMENKPIMRRPVLVKLLYRVNEEIIHRLQADAQLDLASPVFDFVLGTHVCLNGDGELEIRSDENYPGLDWKREETWPPNLCWPEGPTASTFATPTLVEGDGPVQVAVKQTWDTEMRGITTIAVAMDYLRDTTQRWLQKWKEAASKTDGAHGAFLQHRLEHIAWNVLSTMCVKLIPHVLPGRYRARHYGHVRTRNPEFEKNYFYWGQGPNYQGAACFHLPPGRPAWSRAQYVFKQRLFRFKRRKSHVHGNCKPFKKLKVKIPELAGTWTKKLGRPLIGRRYKKRVGGKLVEQIKYAIEHPFHKRLQQEETELRAHWTRSAVIRGLRGLSDPYQQTTQQLMELFKEQVIEDIGQDICKNLLRVSKRRYAKYKRQIINTIGDPVITYGIEAAVKTLRAIDPKKKWTPVFDENNPFDRLLFQKSSRTVFPEDFGQPQENRY